MRTNEIPRFLEVLAGVHDFYGRELSDFAGQVWIEAMQAFDLEQVTKALSGHLMDADRGQWMPKPADIVRQLQGTNTDRALIAWGKTLQAIQQVGAYASVCFDDGVIHAVIEDMGGWPKLCRGKVDDLPHVQRRFCETYRAYAARGADIGYPAKLLGEYDQTNATRGLAAQAPTLVGNPAKAAQIGSGAARDKAQITTSRQQAQDLSSSLLISHSLPQARSGGQ